MESFVSPTIWEMQSNQYESHQTDQLCASMDIDSFVSNLPNLDELEATNDHQQLMVDNQQHLHHQQQQHHHHLETVNHESLKSNTTRLIAIQDLNMYHSLNQQHQLQSIDIVQEEKNQLANEASYTPIVTMSQSHYKANQYNQHELQQPTVNAHNLELITASLNEPMSKVEILNHIISNNLNYTRNDDSESFNESDFSMSDFGSRRKAKKGKRMYKRIRLLTF